MPQQLINRIPEKHRFLSILVITSMLGVALILVSVYNASRDLELLHAIDSLHRYASAQLHSAHPDARDPQRLLALSAPGYRVMLVRGEEVLADSSVDSESATSVKPAVLEENRVNEHGGYLDLDGRMLTWTRVRLPKSRAELIFLHDFEVGDMASMIQVYFRRLLIPAGFYIWLMVWMGYVLRYLTDELSRQKEEMEYLALHDTLSGLPNRNLLNDRLEKRIAVSQRDRGCFALAMIDLDGFKDINDTLGHDAGDAMLQEIARRLSACVRSVDTVARVGGDEFVLLLDDLDKAGSLDICQRAAAEIARPVSVRDSEVRVGASIGIAMFPRHGDDVEMLTRHADQAMYAVKADGGGIRLYTAETPRENLLTGAASTVSV